MSTIYALPQPKTEIDHRKRALGLIVAGQASGLWNSAESLARVCAKWFDSKKQELQSEFSPAANLVRRDPISAYAEASPYFCSMALLADTLGRLLLAEESAAALKRRGAVFTPPWLAHRVVLQALGHWRRLHRTAELPQTIADVSCGAGVFLQAVHSIAGSAAEIHGADFDPSAIAYTRLLASVLGANWDLRCEDSLFVRPSQAGLFGVGGNDSDRQCDLLIGNPPYVRSPLLDPSYVADLRADYSCVPQGNFDLSVTFIEHAIDSLRDGGIASYIVSNKFMTMAYGRHICGRLAREVRVLQIDDFQDHQIFQGYATYTCVLTFAKIAQSSRLTLVQFNKLPNEGDYDSASRKSTLPSETLRSHPWTFTGDATHEILRLIHDPKNPLLESNFRRIIQGLRTGCNQVFVVGDDAETMIEADVTLPFINGEHIRRLRVDDDKLRIIFPYKRNGFGQIILRTQEELAASFPMCWDHLKKNRALLDDRMKDERVPWFAYSRSQNLDLAQLPKLLVREMMPRAEFAADPSGCMIFASGYALDAGRMRNETLIMWTAVLCTPTMEFALRYSGTQLQSGWFRLLKHHLRRVHLPPLAGTQLGRAAELARRLELDPNDVLLWNELDELVAFAFGLNSMQRRHINLFLKDCHARSLPKLTEYPDVATSPSTNRGISQYEPVRLNDYNRLHRERPDLGRMVTFVPNKEIPIHRWYKYTQGFSAPLVDHLLAELDSPSLEPVLDPFAGSGTTNLVCRQRGIPSYGLEISPLMKWIADAKTYPWEVRELRNTISDFRLPGRKQSGTDGYEKNIFSEYLLKAFASPILRQLWTLADVFRKSDIPPSHRVFLQLALVTIMEDVSQIRKHGSHYRYMLNTGNVGLEKLNIRIISPEADIVPLFRERLSQMLDDIDRTPPVHPTTVCDLYLGDARQLPFPAQSFSSIITSPPYLNRNNYIAQQKAELAILNLLKNENEYRKLVQSTLRSHVEAKFAPGSPKTDIPELRPILEALELTENNNAKIPHMIAGYFEDMATVFGELNRVMRRGAKLAMIVGNSRWGGVVVPVDHLLLKIGERVGLTPERILISRHKGNSPQQMRQYGRIPVRESIIIMRKP